VASYTIYVSENGGAWTAWLSGTVSNTATFSGQPGHTYAFYSVARDNAGNLESAAPVPEAVTTVIGMPLLSITQTNNQVIVSWPQWAQGFHLESADSILPRINWEPVMEILVVVGGQYAVTLDAVGSGKFFRLSQSAPLPTLSIGKVNNQVIISWPQWAEGFQLESSTNLVPPIDWQPVTNSPVVIGGQYTVTLDAGCASMFYRLRLTATTPRLSMVRANGRAVISWPQWAEGFQLESTDGLIAPSWQTVSDVPVAVGWRKAVTLQPTNASRFYRLRKP